MSVTQGTWHTGEQIRDHKLACSIVNLHGTPDAVFDIGSEWLDMFKRFTDNRSMETRDAILRENGWVDESGTRRGKKAGDAGNLPGFVIARYGTDDPAFDERDWEILTEWLEKGCPLGEHVSR